MSHHIVTLWALTFTIALVTPWESTHLVVRALCPPHQAIHNSPLQTRFHDLTRHEHQDRPLYSVDPDVTDEPRQSLTPRSTTPTGRKPFLHTLSRTLLATASVAILPLSYPTSRAAAAAPTKDKPTLPATLAQIKEARTQMEPIPSLIASEKWDSIRQILATPPLSDCWMKTGRPLLVDYTNALADDPASVVSDDAEFDALGFKEEALDHLRFLDMSAYNNVFNPIKSEGESGASKALVKSYYEDPGKELKASVDALDGLVKLVKAQ